MTASTSPPPAWTCPFCSLLCDEFRLSDEPAPRLLGSDCPRAREALAEHVRAGRPPDAGASAAAPREAIVDGNPMRLHEALDAAAQRLARWRQPLFGGLQTDVAGARALYRLAARTGAICDHADGRALMHGLRAQQDRGQYTATLGEVRTRADLIVCVGTPGSARYPELFRRFGLGRPESPCRTVAFLNAAPAPDLPGSVEVVAVAGSGDAFADLQRLAALVARRPTGVAAADPAVPADPAALAHPAALTAAATPADLAALADRLHAARYAVLVWEAGALPAHGELLVEALGRIVASLNHHTRAATFGLGGSDGAYAVNQTFTWLSGLPLRTRIGREGLEHQPALFDAQRLLDGGAVDGLLWIASFDPGRLPPATALPRIVLGAPALGDRLRDAGRLHDCVFVPVATPGLNAAGHLFRTDGGIVLPLVAARDDGLPGVADVLDRLAGALDGATGHASRDATGRAGRDATGPAAP